jgi:hypothetical protein
LFSGFLGCNLFPFSRNLLDFSFLLYTYIHIYIYIQIYKLLSKKLLLHQTLKSHVFNCIFYKIFKISV